MSKKNGGETSQKRFAEKGLGYKYAFYYRKGFLAV
jgi:hypothetical protein